MAVQGISWSGVLMRVVFAVALVLLTFYHWAVAPPPGITALKAFLGILLLIGWVICLRTAFVALGWLGVTLGVALLGTMVWLLVDMKMVDTTPSMLAWIALVSVGVVLGIGLSWSLIRARTTGQIEVQ
jgi:hypothetical protein